jgi:hypothetical protein
MIHRNDVRKAASSSSINTLKPKACSSYSYYVHILLYVQTWMNLGQFYILSVTEGLNDCIYTTAHSLMMGQLGRKYVGVCVLKHYRYSKCVRF